MSKGFDDELAGFVEIHQVLCATVFGTNESSRIKVYSISDEFSHDK